MSHNISGIRNSWLSLGTYLDRCIKAFSNSLPTMSAFNQKQGKKALYQIQRCAYTELYSTWSPGVELAMRLKPRDQGIKFLMELGSRGKGINFSRRRRECLEIPLLHAPSRGCYASLFLFSPLHCFFRPVKEWTD